jgi:hypothetical protein
VPQLLSCPNQHHWDLTEHPFEILARTHGLCPQCGEPPAADSPVDWEPEWRGLLILLPVLLFTLVAASVPVFFLATNTSDPGGWPCITLGVALLVSALVTGFIVGRRRRRLMREAARTLGFDFLPSLRRARARELGLPPFLWKNFAYFRENCLHGHYQGSRAVFFDGVFRGRTRGTPVIQSAVVFLDPIPGVPDFFVEPALNRNQFRNRTVAYFLGFGRLGRFREEPFGAHYDLQSGNDAAVRGWLSLPLCDFLRDHPGWVLGSWHGRFYLYRPERRCRADACATLIAVAWRLRDLLGQPDPHS